MTAPLRVPQAAGIDHLSSRWLVVGLEAFIAIGALAGTWQLWDGTFAPPVSDLEPLGLDSWRLPAVWLFVSVAAPSLVALYAAATDRTWAPYAVLVASVLLVVEVTVQIPFVGPSILQAVFGGLALVLGAVAVVSLRRRVR